MLGFSDQVGISRPDVGFFRPDVGFSRPGCWVFPTGMLGFSDRMLGFSDRKIIQRIEYQYFTLLLNILNYNKSIYKINKIIKRHFYFSFSLD